MSSGVLGVGVSGLTAAQRSLSTASHNIANVNTDGYSRQRVDQVARDPLFMGSNYLGTGVQVDSVKRIVSDFQDLQIRNSSAGLSQAQTYQSMAARVDNLFTDPTTGLSSSLQAFYDAVQGVANSPSTLPERQVMLSSGDTLAGRFHDIIGQLNNLRDEFDSQLRSNVTEVNTMSQSIADINRQIVLASSVGNGQPNDLLDRRDQLIRQLSEKVATTTVVQDDGSINVSIGNGQALVTGSEARKLTVSESTFDSSRLEISYETPSGPMEITRQIRGGVLGGLVGFRTQVLDPATNTLGKIAVGVSSAVNAQHQLGIDLKGNAGGDFFYALDSGTTPAAVQVLGAQSNSTVVPAAISAAITDIASLTSSDYRLDRKGNEYSVTRISDGQVTRLTGFPASPATVDGVTIQLTSGAMADGDAFLIQPTSKAAAGFTLAISDPSQIAAASPQRSAADASNAGTATISAATVADSSTYVAGNYQIQLGATTAAVANGTSGTISDTGAANNLQYQLAINGVTVYTQDEGTAPLADLNAVAANINDDVATTGVRAYVDASANRLYLANDPARAGTITVNETLVDSGGAPLDSGDSVTGYFGGALTGASTSASVTYSSADGYLVQNSSGTVIADGAYTSPTTLNFNGISVDISGNAAIGDRFSVNTNNNGVGDNRNALALAGLQNALIMDGGTATVGDIYSGMVVDVGNRTSQAEITMSAQESLLTAAEADRAATSGVNLDEEAAAVMKFQQAYQASAQVISTANSLFATLLAAFR